MTNTIPASNAATTASSRPPKSAAVVAHLRDLVKSIPECPSLLQGKVRQTKVRRYCGNRQGASRSAPNASGEICKIDLTGYWIAEAGFTAEQPIRIIPMEHMLIIIPES